MFAAPTIRSNACSCALILLVVIVALDSGGNSLSPQLPSLFDPLPSPGKKSAVLLPGADATQVDSAQSAGQASSLQPVDYRPGDHSSPNAPVRDDLNTGDPAGLPAPRTLKLELDEPTTIFSLRQAIDFGVRNNPRLRAALAAIERARGQEQAAFAPFLPQIDFLTHYGVTSPALGPASAGSSGIILPSGDGMHTYAS